MSISEKRKWNAPSQEDNQKQVLLARAVLEVLTSIVAITEEVQ
jgi:hypothetical protein